MIDPTYYKIEWLACPKCGERLLYTYGEVEGETEKSCPVSGCTGIIDLTDEATLKRIAKDIEEFKTIRPVRN